MKNAFRRLRRYVLFALSDFAIIAFSYYAALYVVSGSFKMFFHNASHLNTFILPFAVVYWVVFAATRLYNTLWRFSGVREVSVLIVAVFGSSLICFSLYNSVYAIVGFKGVNLTHMLFVTAPFFISVVAALERMAIRSLVIRTNRKADVSRVHGNAMLIGAGAASALLIQNLDANDYMSDMRAVCIVDDDPLKQGMMVNNVMVCGTRHDIIRLCKERNIDTIVFAIPSCPTEEKIKILKICQMTGCRLKTLPHVYQLPPDNEISAKSVRNVEIEDLLGREPIRIDLKKVSDYVKDKIVMVTGGGGSIGSELCRQIASRSPKQLIVFDVYENNAFDIQNELKHMYPELDLVVLIGSVRDSKRLDRVFDKYRPQIVYHAAAHKHVPLMEDSPNEAIKNNVIGTLKTVRASDKYSVERFVLISTDKAVNPTNIMGATKRICEMIVQTYNNHSKTDFVAVRFGNVLGSNGSVIPLFKRQIAEGGPITVTDPNIIRYFMTIPEAVSLVLEAGTTAKGGEIFVLDMGKPVRIVDLAENLIRLSGYTPYVDIDIKFIGLRPGEKMYEELLISEEGLSKTDNDLIYIGKPIDIDEDKLNKCIEELQSCMYDDNVDVRHIVKEIVPTYTIK